MALQFSIAAGKMVRIYGNCLITGKEYSVKAKLEDVVKWQSGTLAQDAFPYLSTDDREFLISGYSPEGWKQAFGEES